MDISGFNCVQRHLLRVLLFKPLRHSNLLTYLLYQIWVKIRNEWIVSYPRWNVTLHLRLCGKVQRIFECTARKYPWHLHVIHRKYVEYMPKCVHSYPNLGNLRLGAQSNSRSSFVPTNKLNTFIVADKHSGCGIWLFNYKTNALLFLLIVTE